MADKVSQLAELLSEVARTQVENERLKWLLKEANDVVNTICNCDQMDGCFYCKNKGGVCSADDCFKWRRSEEVQRILEEQADE